MSLEAGTFVRPRFIPGPTYDGWSLIQQGCTGTIGVVGLATEGGYARVISPPGIATSFSDAPVIFEVAHLKVVPESEVSPKLQRILKEVRDRHRWTNVVCIL